MDNVCSLALFRFFLYDNSAISDRTGPAIDAGVSNVCEIATNSSQAKGALEIDLAVAFVGVSLELSVDVYT